MSEADSTLLTNKNCNIMTNNNQLAQQKPTVTSLFSQENVKKKFEEMMGKNAPAFITSVLQIVSSNDLLKNADPMSVYQSAAVAATLNLPLNNNLGFAYIVPYKQKQKDNTYKTVAQFQLGYKGFKQLAQRSGQFKFMSETDVREGEIIEHNRLTGEMKFNWIQNESERQQKAVVGYISYFRLLNGFESTYYMPIEKMIAHSKKYSQTAKKGFGLWIDAQHEMSLKTIVKLNLSKNAPLSIEMQQAVEFDQSVIDENGKPNYSDNEEIAIDKEAERIQLMIDDCKTVEELELLQETNPDVDSNLIDKRKEAINSQPKTAKKNDN